MELTASPPAGLMSVRAMRDGASRIARALGDPILLVRVAMLIACVSTVAWTEADPDLWGHVRFGGDIVSAREVPRVDPYSFTSDRPWMNHEWLAEVAMFAAWREAGNEGLIALKLALVAMLVLLAAQELRRSVARPFTRDAFLVLLVVGILPRALPVRPQLFSLALEGLLLSLLLAADRGRWRLLACVPLVMAAWVNLHGGWLVGLATLGIWATVRFWRPVDGLTRWALVGVAGASVAATLLNPYGIGLWNFLHETVRLSRVDIADWQPMYRMPAVRIVLWALVAGVALAVAIRRWRQIDLAHALIVVWLTVLSLRVSRLDAFLAIAVVMLLPRALGQSRGIAASPATVHDRNWRTVVGTIVLIPGILWAPVHQAVANRIDRVGLHSTLLPEPEAAQFVLANHLAGRMITWYDWGEYAIWHFSPAIQISMDGRRETVYSDAVVQANWQFATATSVGALVYPQHVNARYVWMPNNARVVPALERRGWIPIFSGPISTILEQTPLSTYIQPHHGGSSHAFPGP